MAHLDARPGRRPGGLSTVTMFERGDSPSASPASRRGASLAPKYGPEETIPGLECSYGSFAYCYADTPLDMQNFRMQSRRRGCHNPIEAPEERRHCATCGGDYCAFHADPAAHDCENVILSH